MVKERRYPLAAVPFPQAACVKCARLGARGFICDRSCPQETVTVWSLRQYLALAAKVPKRPQPGTRHVAMIARWVNIRASK